MVANTRTIPAAAHPLPEESNVKTRYDAASVNTVDTNLLTNIRYQSILTPGRHVSTDDRRGYLSGDSDII